jgi:hypothetical protein
MRLASNHDSHELAAHSLNSLNTIGLAGSENEADLDDGPNWRQQRRRWGSMREWEIPFQSLVMEEEIGSGSFGMLDFIHALWHHNPFFFFFVLGPSLTRRHRIPRALARAGGREGAKDGKPHHAAAGGFPQ